MASRYKICFNTCQAKARWYSMWGLRVQLKGRRKLFCCLLGSNMCYVKLNFYLNKETNGLKQMVSSLKGQLMKRERERLK